MAEAVNAGGSKDPKTKVAEMVAMVMPTSPPTAPADDAAGEPSVAPPSYESHRSTRGSASARASGGAGAGAGEGAGGASARAAAAAAAARTYTLDELRALPVRELKRLMQANEVSAEGAVEKEEFVQILYALQQGRYEEQEQEQ